MQSNLIAGILKRRLLIVFLAIALLVVGVPLFKELPLQAYPGAAPLSVQAITQQPDRSMTEVGWRIAIPIENALVGVSDIQSFHPVSLFGLSMVILKFREGTDSFKTRQNFPQHSASASLPMGVQSSLSLNSDITDEITRPRLEDDSIDLATLKSYQDYDISERLKHVQEVAGVSSFGDGVKEYHVVLPPAKLPSYGIMLSQLITAIGNANSNTGGNLLRDGEQQLVVRGVSLLQAVDDTRSAVMTASNGVPVHVRDIAEVEVGNMQHLGQAQYNDQPDVTEGIVLPKRDASTTKVLVKVRERVAELSNGILLKSIQIKPFYDRQVLFDIIMDTVEHMLVVGITPVLAVLFVFLGNLRMVAVVVVMIPLTLCVSSIGMGHFHMLTSLISLGVVDSEVIVNAAMIVMENIMRHLEEGAEKLEDAIVRATNKVQRVMIFPTSIIIVAYLPLPFIGGVEDIILKPVAFMMSFALMASIVLSLTFVLAATSFVFGRTSHPHLPAPTAAILRWYKSLLRKLIARPMTAFVTTIMALSPMLHSATFLGTKFLLMLEEDNLWLRTTLSSTVDLEYSASVANDLRTYSTKQSEIRKVSMQIGRPDDGTNSTGMSNQEYDLHLAPPNQWTKDMTKGQLVERLSKHLKKIPGIEYSSSQYIQDNVDEVLSGVKGENSVKLFGNDLNVLEVEADETQAQPKKVQGLVDVDIFRELGWPTLNVSVNCQATARFNTNVSDVQNLVQCAIDGAPATQILEGEKSFGLMVRLNQQARVPYDATRELLIDTPDGQHIPLSIIARVEMIDGLFFIYHEEGKCYIAIKFGVRGRDLDGVMDEAQRVVGSSVRLPEDYTVKQGGQFDEMKATQGRPMVIVPLTIPVTFLLLYNTFGNFKDALMMALNVPFAAIDGLLALHTVNETLLILAEIGFLSLFDIAIQDGVILISYVNHLSQSKNIREATIDGAALRLRPVIMTAMLVGLGLLSAVLSYNIGLEAQRPLVLVIVDSMVITTTLTLLVLPVVFAWAHRHRRPPPRDSDINPTAAMLP